MKPSKTSKTKPRHSRRFAAIGTQWEITLDETPDDDDDLWQAVHDEIAAYDKTYSRFRSDSLVTEMSRTAGDYTLPAEATELLNTYWKLYELTNGALTPLIGQALSDLGYDADYSLQPGAAASPPAWDEILNYRSPLLHVSQPCLLDFGAAGKGQLIDLVSAVIETYNVSSYCVDGSGDIRARGRVQTIGLEHPQDAEQLIGRLELKDRSICGSAGNRRTWAGYSHIIDPRSLHSPADISATWVVADDTLTADGLSTALFFTEPARLQAAFSFDHLIVYRDGSVAASPLFQEALFT